MEKASNKIVRDGHQISLLILSESKRIVSLFHDGGRYHIETANLLRKSMDWFLYDIGLRHERVNF